MTLPYTDQIAADGFAIVENVLPPATVQHLISAVSRPREGKLHALRGLLTQIPEVADLSRSPALRQLVEPILGPTAVAVRGILFDKTDAANWKVAWHQDLSIAVKERREVGGYGPWSTKAGVPHVQPPRHVLDHMLTLRLHLDDCDATNGPLKVIPRSHSAGLLTPTQIDHHRTQGSQVECHAPAGSAVIMRPLILHASSPATEPRHRRVLHVEYAGVSLDGGLDWHEAIR